MKKLNIITALTVLLILIIVACKKNKELTFKFSGLKKVDKLQFEPS